MSTKWALGLALLIVVSQLKSDHRGTTVATVRVARAVAAALLNPGPPPAALHVEYAAVLSSVACSRGEWG